MEIRQLRYFHQICKDKSFSKASKNCFISQQGLSQSISILEAELGVSLFIRTPKGIQLTPQGLYLQQNSTSILEAVDALTNDIKAMAKPKIEVIRIGFASGVISALLTGDRLPLNEFTLSNQFSFLETTDFLCEKNLLEGITDIAFTIGPVNPNEFHHHHVQTNQMCVTVNRENPISSKNSVYIKDLQGQPIITVDEKYRSYFNLKKLCEEFGFKPHLKNVVSEITTMHLMVKNNLGLGISVDFIAEQIQDERVKVVPFINNQLPWEVYMIMPIGSTHREDVQLFWEQVVSQLEQRPQKMAWREVSTSG